MDTTTREVLALVAEELSNRDQECPADDPRVYGRGTLGMDLRQAEVVRLAPPLRYGPKPGGAK